MRILMWVLMFFSINTVFSQEELDDASNGDLAHGIEKRCQIKVDELCGAKGDKGDREKACIIENVGEFSEACRNVFVDGFDKNRPFSLPNKLQNP